jgi:hypothetical protein
MSHQPVARSIVAVDVERYSRRDNPGQLYLRHDLDRVLTEAFADAGIERPRKEAQDGGDAWLMLFPPEVSKVRLLDNLPQQLAGALGRLNKGRTDEARLRLRVAVHAGEVHLDETGYPSEAVVHTVRLRDSAVVKSALRASATDLVLVVSDYLYDSVVRHGYGALESRNYLPREVVNKEFRARAWLQVVGRGGSLGETPLDPSPPDPSPQEERRAGSPSPAIARTALDVAAELGRNSTFLGPTSFGGPAAGRDVNIHRPEG